MYKKLRGGRRPLYFRYAPPMAELDEYSVDELPKLPFKGAKPYQRSVYYYWWLFLREHEGYRACCKAKGRGEYAALYRDFGDVRDDDFLSWWKQRGRRLFSAQRLPRINMYRDPAFRLDDKTRVVVSLPINRDVEGMVAELKQLLLPLQEGVGMRRPSSRARYEVARKPVLSSLHQHWKIWTLRKQHPRKALHEIATLAGIKVGEKNFSDTNQVKAITVSRYLRQAKTLIEFVGMGLFPVMKPEQAASPKKLGRNVVSKRQIMDGKSIKTRAGKTAI